MFTTCMSCWLNQSFVFLRYSITRLLKQQESIYSLLLHDFDSFYSLLLAIKLYKTSNYYSLYCIMTPYFTDCFYAHTYHSDISAHLEINRICIWPITQIVQDEKRSDLIYKGYSLLCLPLLAERQKISYCRGLTSVIYGL